LRGIAADGGDGAELRNFGGHHGKSAGHGAHLADVSRSRLDAGPFRMTILLPHVAARVFNVPLMIDAGKP
jgi:hypothetical protein